MLSATLHLGIFILLCSWAASEDLTANGTYLRPALSQVLDFQHVRLKRKASSAAPEQVHQSLVLSPGTVAISWVTHSQVCA